MILRKTTGDKPNLSNFKDNCWSYYFLQVQDTYFVCHAMRWEGFGYRLWQLGIWKILHRLIVRENVGWVGRETQKNKLIKNTEDRCLMRKYITCTTQYVSLTVSAWLYGTCIQGFPKISALVFWINSTDISMCDSLRPPRIIPFCLPCRFFHWHVYSSWCCQMPLFQLYDQRAVSFLLVCTLFYFH